MRSISLLFLALPLFSQSPWDALKYPPLKPLTPPKVESSALPNGMQIMLLENHELPTIRGIALVRTGNLFDPKDKIGLATITGEVLRSGGTEAQTGDRLDEQLEDVAASVESTIGESTGTVTFFTLKEHAGGVLDVFRDVLTRPTFREDKVALAKSQQASLLARRNDDAQAIASREFAGLLYGKTNSYGWDMTYATVNAISRTDVQDFYRRYFFPANIILAVTGDFSAPEMKSRIEQLFAGWTVKQPAVPPFPPVTKQNAAGTFLASKADVTQTTFAIGSLGTRLDDTDYPALEVMADILGGGFRSRLFQTVRTKLGYAYNISADWGANYDHPGLFQISGSTKSASTVEAIRVARRELDLIRTAEVTPAELETAKQSVLNSFVFNFDTASKTLNRVLLYKYFGYPDDFLFRYQKAVTAVTRADILRVAKQHIDPAQLTILAVGNQKEFGDPLSKLGLPVKTIDIQLPEPEAEVSKADSGSLAAGRQLLAQAQAALGGADKLAAIHDLSQKAHMRVSPAGGGLTAEQWNRWIGPSTFRQDATYPFGKLTVFFDGKSGWIITPQGGGPLPDAERRQIEGELFRFFIPLILSDRDSSRRVNLVSPGTLEITGFSGQAVRLAIDPQTHLPLEAEYQSGQPGGPPVKVTQHYDGFQSAGDVKLPAKVTVSQNGQKFAELTVDGYQVNSGLTAEVLSKKP